MDVMSIMKFEYFLKNSAIVVTFITAFFYCSSTVYTHAYLGRLGLDSDVLERSFHAVVYQGFIFNLGPMLIFLIVVIGLIWIKTIITIQLHRSIKEKRKDAKILINLKNKIFNFFKIKNKSLDYFERPLIKGSLSFTIAFFLLFIALLTLAKFEKKGSAVANVVNQNIANQLREKAAHNDSAVVISRQRNSIIIPSLPKNGTELIFLYCGSHMCAGFDIDKEQVIYFPNTSFSFKSGVVDITSIPLNNEHSKS